MIGAAAAAGPWPAAGAGPAAATAAHARARPRARRRRRRRRHAVSPLQGTVLKVAVEEGDEVDEGALVCVIEAMKMENEITAHRAASVVGLSVTEGGSVAAGDTIAKIE